MRTCESRRTSARFILSLGAFALVISAMFAIPASAHANPSVSKPVAGVNYDDPNLATGNEFVSDSVTSCPSTLKGKALNDCLERTGLKNSELAQVSDALETAPLRAHRTGGSAR